MAPEGVSEVGRGQVQPGALDFTPSGLEILGGHCPGRWHDFLCCFSQHS